MREDDVELSKKSLKLFALIILGGCSVEDPVPAAQEEVEQIPFLEACACEMIVDWSNVTTYKDGSVLDPRSDINSIVILVFNLSTDEYSAMANGELQEYQTLDYMIVQTAYPKTSDSFDTSGYSDKVMAIRVSAEEDSMLITNIYDISSSISENILVL